MSPETFRLLVVVVPVTLGVSLALASRLEQKEGRR